LTIRFLFISLALILYSEALMAFTVRQVSPEEINDVIQSGKASRTHYYLVAQIDPKKEKEKKKGTQSGQGSPDVLDAIDFSTQSFSGSTSEEAALVMFALVGLVIIVAWIPYVPMLLYKGVEEKKFDHLVQLNWNPVIGHNRGDKHGSMTGLNYGFYLEDSHIGLSLESGYYRLNQNEGSYWLSGPSIVFGDMKPETLFGRVDLMAGSSFDANLGLMSRAEFSGNFISKSGYTFGASIGGLYLKHHEEDPLIGQTHQLGFIFGFKFGHKF
jgi:hypothetical protein